MKSAKWNPSYLRTRWPCHMAHKFSVNTSVYCYVNCDNFFHTLCLLLLTHFSQIYSCIGPYNSHSFKQSRNWIFRATTSFLRTRLIDFNILLAKTLLWWNFSSIEDSPVITIRRCPVITIVVIPLRRCPDFSTLYLFSFRVIKCP